MRSKPFINNCEFPNVKLERLKTPLSTDNDEFEECLDNLIDEGIVESFIGEDGKVWYKLTKKGRAEYDASSS